MNYDNNNEYYRFFRQITDTNINLFSESVVVLDNNFNIITHNKAFGKEFFVNEDIETKHLYDICNGIFKNVYIKCFIEDIFSKQNTYNDYLLELSTEENLKKIFSINANRILNIAGVGTIVVLVFNNLSRLSQVEEERRIDETKYKTLFDGITEAVYQISAEGKLITFNQAFADMLGYTSPEDILNLDIANDIYVNSTDRKAKLEKLEQYGEIRNYEVLLRTKDGRQITVLENAHIIKDITNQSSYYEGILIDISERKEAEKVLQESESRFRFLAENANDVIWMVDMELNLVYISPSITRLLGYTQEEAYNNPMDKVYTKASFDLVMKTFNEEILIINSDITNSNISKTLDLELNHKTGKTIPVEVNFNLIRDKDNKPVNILAVARDITERKQMEEQLIKEKNKAQQADNLKSAFLANMSHEIRTPLNGIIGFTELLGDPNLTEDKKNDYLQIVRKCGNLLLTIINDVVDISKIEAGQMKIKEKSMNINTILDELYEFFTNSDIVKDKKHILFTLKKSLNDAEAYISSDDFRLKQILSNLLDNSFKFTEYGSIDFGYSIEGDKIKFYVKDTGLGISEDKIQYIFDRFWQNDITHHKSYNGTGLGLAISKNLIELMQGEIWCETKLTQGSTFYFSLPYKPEKVVVPAPLITNDIKQDITHKKMKILIVEDDFHNYMFAKALLGAFNIDHLWADSGKKAIEICKTNNDLDLILMDIRLPEMDGYETTKHIREFMKTIPIIALTAYAMADDKQKAMDEGMDDYLAKPFTGDKLLEIITKWVKS